MRSKSAIGGELPIRQDDLASAIGSTRETVSLAIASFRRPWARSAVAPIRWNWSARLLRTWTMRGFSQVP